MEIEKDIAKLEEDDGEGEKVIEGIEDEPLKQSLQTEVARKKHFRTKFKDEETAHTKTKGDLKTVQEALKKYEVDGKPVTSGGTPASPAIDAAEIDARVELRVAGYTTPEIDFIKAFATGNKMTLADAAKSDFVIQGIEGLRKKAKAVESTPDPSGRAPSGAQPKVITDVPAAQGPEFLRKALEKNEGGGKRDSQ